MRVLMEFDGVTLDGANLCGLDAVESLMMATFAMNLMKLIGDDSIPRHIAAAGVSVVFGAMPTDLRARFEPLVAHMTAVRLGKSAPQNAPGGQA